MTVLDAMIATYGQRPTSNNRDDEAKAAWAEYDALVAHRKENELQERMWRWLPGIAMLPILDQIAIVTGWCKDEPRIVTTDAFSKWEKDNHSEVTKWAVAKHDATIAERNKKERERAEAENLRDEYRAGPWQVPRSWADIDVTGGMGLPGRGKSDIVKKVAKQQGWKTKKLKPTK
jgi:hypothetical protein